jgi:hypothetical protein
MTVITMSRNELMRLRVLIDVGDGRLSVEDATGLIGVGRRQIVANEGHTAPSTGDALLDQALGSR